MGIGIGFGFGFGLGDRDRVWVWVWVWVGVGVRLDLRVGLQRWWLYLPWLCFSRWYYEGVMVPLGRDGTTRLTRLTCSHSCVIACARGERISLDPALVR